MNESFRSVPSYYDAEGRITASSSASPTDNTSRARVYAPPPDVLPIVFVPGIMGSNLCAKQAVTSVGGDMLVEAGKPVWLVDSATRFGLKWSEYTAAERQLLIDKDNLDVDTSGLIRLRSDEPAEAAMRDFMRMPRYGNLAAVEQAQKLRKDVNDAIAEKRRRGWGTVSWAFYGSFLQWLEQNLQGLAMQGGRPNNKLATLLRMAGRSPDGASSGSASVPAPPLKRDLVERMLEFHFPVWGVGYNWAASNMDSGRILAQKIDDIIAEYDGRNGQRCSQVIVVTHSMGGLVARAAAKKYNAESKIAGVVHGVMPTHGAAAMYKRSVAGFGNEGAWFMEKVLGAIIGASSARALGRTARETLPVLAFNPGPLELAPNHRYNNGQPWLIIRGKKGGPLKALPERGDPYAEIYQRTDVWWRLVNPEWLNPAGLDMTASYFVGQFQAAVAKAKKYHEELARDDEGFHPETYGHYGTDKRHPAWGELTIEVSASAVYERTSLGAYGAGGLGPTYMPPTRIDLPNKVLHGKPEEWRIMQHDADDELLLIDTQGGEMRARIKSKGDPGDATVPAEASAAGIDRISKVVCRHTRGYAHDASYQDDRVRASVLDAVARILARVPARR
ncbi:MAG: esterase/lipase family protein [Luteimonas sp.]